MTDECISPLRRRMIEDMTVRNFAADTQRNYLRAVKNLAIFLGRSPDTAAAEERMQFAADQFLRSGQPLDAERCRLALAVR